MVGIVFTAILFKKKKRSNIILPYCTNLDENITKKCNTSAYQLQIM